MNASNASGGCKGKSYFDASLFIQWKNYSTFKDDAELEAYICDYSLFLEYRDRIRYVNGWSSIACSLVGVASSTLTLATLWSNKKLNAQSFLYFRVISFLELFHMAYIFMMGLQQIRLEDFTRNFAWFWFMTCIGVNIGNIFSISVDFATIFVSIERAVACLLPKQFAAINRRSVAVSVCIGSVVAAASLNLPQCLSKRVVIDQTGQYSAVPSVIGAHPAYVTFDYFMKSFFFFLAACFIISAAMVVIGMVKSLKLKRALRDAELAGGRQNDRAKKSTWTKTAQQTNMRMNLQLCYLQVSQALPSALNYVLYTAHVIAFASVNVGFVSVSSGIDLEAAKRDLRASYNGDFLRLLVLVTNDLAHSFHFYLYLCFSRRFRSAFRERFFKTPAANQTAAPAFNKRSKADRSPLANRASVGR